MIKIACADKCPADKIREIIEGIIKIREKLNKKGKQIPKELSVPKRIEISPQNMEYFKNSALMTDFVGGVLTAELEQGREVEASFGAERTAKFPPLKVMIRYEEESGVWCLKYIKEYEKTKKGFFTGRLKVKKPAFEWIEEDTLDKEGTLILCRPEEYDDYVNSIAASLDDMYSQTGPKNKK